MLLDDQFAADVRELCKEDIVFWVNTFCWLMEPRNVGEAPRIFPWISYPYQDELFKLQEECLGKRDLVIVKSRCMGVTWCEVASKTHKAQFWDDMSFGFVSREEKMVDGTAKSLFYKIQFLLDYQPRSLVGDYDHFHMRFLFHRTNSTIEGATSGPHVFRGDRYTGTGHDEVSARDLSDGRGELKSSYAATRSRFMFSTPLGSVGAFYEAAHNASIRRVDIHWTQHPEYNKGLRFIGDKAVRYGKLTFPGKPTSPWYEAECKRLGSDAAVAAELDLDFGGSGKPYFRPEMVEEHSRKHARPPFLKGVLEYAIEGDDSTIRFVEDPDGWLSLWCYLEPDGRVMGTDRYGAGADVATGVGATPSVLTVANQTTREQAAEAATNWMDPKQFARACKMVLYLFRDPMFIWETAGPTGALFGKTIMTELGYTNVYFRQDELGLTNRTQKSWTPGWVPTEQNKSLVLGNFRSALSTDMFILHSAEALAECPLYTFGSDGKVENSLIRASASDARQNHGDRIIAGALCNKALGEPAMKIDVQTGEPALPEDYAILMSGHPLHHTQHARMLAAKQTERREDYWSERGTQAWDSKNRFRRLEW